VRDVNVFLNSLHSALALGPVGQDHLLQARQMQALSFAVHIPLVCFGIAFPVMVLLMEWWGQRTGDPLYRTIARRWSRVMIALFANRRDHGHRAELRDGGAVAELHRDVRTAPLPSRGTVAPPPRGAARPAPGASPPPACSRASASSQSPKPGGPTRSA
jgi:hypothetical protein